MDVALKCIHYLYLNHTIDFNQWTDEDTIDEGQREIRRIIGNDISVVVVARQLLRLLVTSHWHLEFLELALLISRYPFPSSLNCTIISCSVDRHWARQQQHYTLYSSIETETSGESVPLQKLTIRKQKGSAFCFRFTQLELCFQYCPPL